MPDCSYPHKKRRYRVESVRRDISILPANQTWSEEPPQAFSLRLFHPLHSALAGFASVRSCHLQNSLLHKWPAAAFTTAYARVMTHSLNSATLPTDKTTESCPFPTDSLLTGQPSGISKLSFQHTLRGYGRRRVHFAAQGRLSGARPPNRDPPLLRPSLARRT